eukprot:symbB.v1.2.028498.t1/scaffold3021.1/size65149/6
MSDKLSRGHTGTYTILSETQQGFLVSLEDLNKKFLLCPLPDRSVEDASISTSTEILRGAGRGTSKTIPSWVQNKARVTPSEAKEDISLRPSIQVAKEWEEYVDPQTGRACACQWLHGCILRIYSRYGKDDDMQEVNTTKSMTMSQLKAASKGRSWTFSDFELYDTVGKGTFSRVRVVKIKGSVDRLPMALKILRKGDVIRLKQVEHVKAEKQIMSMIEHPFIVNLLGAFQDEKRLFMLLEYVNGGELFSYLRREGRLPNDHVRFYSGETWHLREYCFVVVSFVLFI